MHPESEDDGVGSAGLGCAAASVYTVARHFREEKKGAGNETAAWTAQLWTADYILQVRSELEKVPQIEGIYSLAVAAASRREM